MAQTAFLTAGKAYGAIVGSRLKEGHRDYGTVSESNVEEFMRNWNRGMTDIN